MTQYFIFSDDYPFSADFSRIAFGSENQVILITRKPKLILRSEQKAFIDLVIEVDSFAPQELVSEIDKHVVVESDAIGLSHDDFVYLEVAAVIRHYRMRGMTESGVRPFLDKAVAKGLLALDSVPFPKYYIYKRGAKTLRAPGSSESSPLAVLRFPVFAKPVQGAGAQHASKIDTREQFEAWLESPNLPDHYELDEYVDGANLYHCELLIDTSRVYPLQVCRYSFPCAEFSNGKAVGSYTLDMQSDHIAKAIADFATRSIESIGSHINLPSGVVHLELFYNETGDMLFLEAQLRPPGANVKEIYTIRYRENLENLHFLLQMGRVPPIPVPSGPYAAWIYFPTRTGTVSKTLPLPELKSEVAQCEWNVVPGQKTQLPENILNAVGRGVVALSLVISNTNLSQLHDDFLKLACFEPVVYV